MAFTRTPRVAAIEARRLPDGREATVVAGVHGGEAVIFLCALRGKALLSGK